MNVLLFYLGADTGGVLIATVRAFQRDLRYHVRSLVSSDNYIGYRHDLAFSKKAIDSWWEWADVLHLHHDWVSYDMARNGWSGRNLPHRPALMHYHGTGFREHSRRLIREQRRHKAVGVTATLDLWLLAPEHTHWLPCPLNIEDMQRRRRPVADDVIRIAHAPTNREIKSTAALITAVRRLQDSGYNVELDLIEGVNWDTCLERKSRADIYFDQVVLGYGNNAIECWGMGIPVIAGAAPATLAEMERRFGALPFYRATEGSLYEALKELVTSADLRAEYAERGLAHVRRFHDDRVVVDQLKELYHQAVSNV